MTRMMTSKSSLTLVVRNFERYVDLSTGPIQSCIIASREHGYDCMTVVTVALPHLINSSGRHPEASANIELDARRHGVLEADRTGNRNIRTSEGTGLSNYW